MTAAFRRWNKSLFGFTNHKISELEAKLEHLQARNDVQDGSYATNIADIQLQL